MLAREELIEEERKRASRPKETEYDQRAKSQMISALRKKGLSNDEIYEYMEASGWQM